MSTRPRRGAVAHLAGCRCHAFVMGLLLWAILVAPAAAAADAMPLALEQSVKAAFLYKFLGYVEWPAGKLGAPDAPIVVGVIGAHALAEELTAIAADRRVGERPVEVREIAPGDALGGAHVIFVGSDGMRRLRAASAAGAENSILLVTEADDGLDRGSVINFVEADGRVRFEVSLPAAESSGLKLSSRLLAVAKRVTGRPR